jgi:hypothetical protein
MADLSMSLEDMIKKDGPKGKSKGSGGAIKGGRGSGKQARAAAAPYQKPVKPGKGKGGGGGATLADMAAAAAPAVKPAPQFVLTTGTTLRIGNLDFNVNAAHRRTHHRPEERERASALARHRLPFTMRTATTCCASPRQPLACVSAIAHGG